jgi:FlaA1/EpsC-like NDP-sugar epimerase
MFARNTPRWIIFLIDVLITLFAVALAYLLRFNFAAIPAVEIELLDVVIATIAVCRIVSFYIGKIYAGIVRYTSSKDAQRIFITNSIATLTIILINTIRYYFIDEKFNVPFSIVIIEFMATTFLMISLRVVFKTIYFEYVNPAREKRNVIIFGAGESGIITKRTLDRDAGTKYKVLAFIDDDTSKTGKKLEGATIFQFNKLKELLGATDVAQVVISVQNLSAARKQEIVDICLNYNTKVLTVPPVASWINGELSFKQIKKINIEELLERDPIKLNKENINQQLKNKTVLVTGAAGSIGSEMVRQIANFNPQKIILLDQAESPLYEMEMEMKEQKNNTAYEIVIGDIRNKERMQNLFGTFNPHIVFHAAAYKHVPMMENNPSEAILTNVLGTKTIADLSVAHKVEKFVMVSTDKAVNPTNVMGASKRIAEIYTQSLGKTTTTKFVTTRFGNVLGSNGSVIPRFKQQIEKGGPITITHPDITRFFMTIPEACQLVLEAGAMGNGGEIFIFDMGQSVKIVDLAKKMIKLSGLELEKDIRIVFTGLRPGEKLFEELLADKEKTLSTHHNQIMIASVKKYDYEMVSKEITSIIDLFKSQNNTEIVSRMKLLVPEFLSNNSEFEQLDKK